MFDDYTIHAVDLVIEDKDRLKYVTKQLYPEIEKKYKTRLEMCRT
ncbi:hypothetical protein GPL15_10920 [Clostridium sp. MCC353]|nr:hypothetical protein [Clostridium sp. MCC353]